MADRALYQREYQRARRRRIRDEWFHINGPCRKCGSPDDLVLDHIDPKTKDPILRKNGGSVWTWSTERRERELAKCQALCLPCHQEKTASEIIVSDVPHGTITGYIKRKCRCNLCKQAMFLYRQDRIQDGKRP